ncbi:MAG: DNA polymerase III subunit delta [Clostridia bacterium]|nr:DNA polymerase III subunit delta [Clostridia bacterium]
MPFKNDFLQFNDFKDRLKDMKGPVFLLGNEEFLMKRCIDSAVKAYISPGFEIMDYIKYDEATKDQLLADLYVIPMLSQKRILWVNNYKEIFNDGEFAAKLANYDGDNIIFFTFTDIDEKKQLPKLLKYFGNENIYMLNALDKRGLKAIINNRLKKNGKTISPKNMEELINLSGYFNKDSDYTISNLDFDLQKIIAHSGDNPEISLEDIELSVDGDEAKFVFDFIESLGRGNKSESFHMFHSILKSGSKVEQIAALIAGQFELMVEAKELSEEGYPYNDIIKALGIHEFRAKKIIQAADRFQLSHLKNILINVYDIDREVKMGNIDAVMAYELLIAKI